MVLIYRLLPLLVFGCLAVLSWQPRNPSNLRPRPKRSCSTNSECLARGLPLLKPAPRRRQVGPYVPTVSLASTTPQSDYEYTGSVQTLVVIATGYYKVMAQGASGGNSGVPEGLGANIVGYVYLEQGSRLQVVVGGAGRTNIFNTASGGGGTFLYQESTDGTSVVFILGAGGGGGSIDVDSGFTGGSASTGPDGVNGLGPSAGAGGTNGRGGNGSSDSDAGAGAGYKSSGTAGESASTPGRSGPSWAGGIATSGGSNGGFGGGGAATATSSGSGGGWSGGGASAADYPGVGGGSYMIPAPGSYPAPVYTQADNPGDGFLSIVRIA